MAIGIVVGMVAEAVPAAAPSAALAAPLRPRVFVAGRRPGRAQEGARQLLAEGATALLSFGVAGGLDPALRPGDAVLALGLSQFHGVTVTGHRSEGSRGARAWRGVGWPPAARPGSGGRR